MNAKESRAYQKFVRVRDFGAAHAADFGPNTLGAQTFAILAGIITQIDGLGAAEASAHGGARQGTETRAHARVALREDLEAIARTARVMATEIPGLENKFRVPRNTNDTDLINAARAFKADAQPLSAEFIAHELPSDFLADLQGDIEAMDDAISNQATGVGNHVAASAALDDAFGRGLEVARKLNAIVRNKYANNPAVLAEWTSANHTERAPRRSHAPVVTAPPAASSS